MNKRDANAAVRDADPAARDANRQPRQPFGHSGLLPVSQNSRCMSTFTHTFSGWHRSDQGGREHTILCKLEGREEEEEVQHHYQENVHQQQEQEEEEEDHEEDDEHQQEEEEQQDLIVRQ